jgi:hypothetical protein
MPVLPERGSAKAMNDSCTPGRGRQFLEELQLHRNFIQCLVDSAFDPPVYFGEFISDIPVPEV